MTEQTKLNTKELIRSVANHIDYNLYEVDDVLKGLTDVLQEQLSQGNSVKVMGLGTFHRKENPSKNFKLPNGELKVSEGSYGVRFTPDVPLLRAVNAK